MTLTDEQHESFKEAAKPLIKWLNENCHPHVKVIVTPIDAELVEGTCVARVEEYLRD